MIKTDLIQHCFLVMQSGSAENSKCWSWARWMLPMYLMCCTRLTMDKTYTQLTERRILRTKDRYRDLCFLVEYHTILIPLPESVTFFSHRIAHTSSREVKPEPS